MLYSFSKRGNSGFSILPKDTSACRWGRLGIELPTFWLEDDRSTPEPRYLYYFKVNAACPLSSCSHLLSSTSLSSALMLVIPTMCVVTVAIFKMFLYIVHFHLLPCLPEHSTISHHAFQTRSTLTNSCRMVTVKWFYLSDAIHVPLLSLKDGVEKFAATVWGLCE